MLSSFPMSKISQTGKKGEKVIKNIAA